MPDKPPPQAFKGATLMRIELAIRSMATKLFNHARKPFSAVDLMNLFLEPQLHGPMQIAFNENRGGGLNQVLYVTLPALTALSNQQLNGVEVSGSIAFSWNYAEVPDGFFTRYHSGGMIGTAVKRVQRSAPIELRARYERVAEQMCRISYEWGLIMRVFKELNQPGYCQTPQQMRYVWPSILPILKWTDMDDGLVGTLQHESMRAGDRARVPQHIQPVLRESYQAVTRAMLVLDNPVDDIMGPIKYNIAQPISFRRLTLPFEGMIATT